MKKNITILLIGLVVLAFGLSLHETINAQEKSLLEEYLPDLTPTAGVKRIPQLVENYKLAGAQFERRNLFETNAHPISESDGLLDEISEGVLLDLDKAAIREILKSKPQFFTLTIPDGKGGTIELELYKADIFSEDFKVKTSAPISEKIPVEAYGIHYRGIIKGDLYSLAGISIFNHEVMGIVRSKTHGAQVLGRMGGENPSDRHVFYAEKHLQHAPGEFCNVKADDAPSLPAFSLETQEELLVRCVRIYLEANHDLFLNKGSVANTAAYITGFFNQSAILFANDGIPVAISEIFVWNSPSPYTGADSLAQLNLFRTTRTSFNGDLAHLITLDNGYGGIAYVNVLCNNASRYAFSAVHTTYINVPTYSWTVGVFTHETGHNLGSPHTHACAWNGNNTAIDGCWTTEGGCASPGIPAGGGTIMSYCHLQSVGINFNLGFGPQPRALIQSRFNAAPCLIDCGTTTPGNVQFTASSYTANEGSGTATITVTRANGTAAFNINYATSNGSATAGSDYTATSGTLIFAASENSKTFTVPIINDTAVEGNETFNLSLSSPTNGATLGTPSTTVVTIIDNDTQACTYSLNPTGQSVPQAGGSYSVQVTTQAGCAWSAVSNSLVESNSSSNEKSSYENLTPAFSEGFENITTLPASGWFTQNNSVPVGSTGWFQGNSTTFSAQGGSATSYIGANFNNTTATNTISNWLLTPTITFNNGDVIRFWTRTASANPFPDRLQVRRSLNGTSTNVGAGATGVGDFTTVLLDINPIYQTGGVYPEVWTEYTVTISGLGTPTNGRLGFRYFVENGGPTGANSNYIGIDTFSYTPATTSSWITVNSGSSGIGSGTVNYSVGTNSTGSARTGTMTIAGQTFTVNQSSSTISTRKQFDFDGDNKTDVAIFRPSNGQWWVNRSSNGSTFATTFGASTDRIAPLDYTGDSRADIAFWRPSNGQWNVLRSNDFTFYAYGYGTSGDIPASGFFDGDNQADTAVFRPSNATWYIRRSTDGGSTIVQFGANGDIPVVADYDGDGRDDMAIYRPLSGQWWINRSSLGVVAYQFGTSTDKPITGDFTGDGKADAAFWRPSTGQWFVLRSENLTFFAAPFGTNNDIPLAGDWDGDGINDFAVFRPSTNVWYVSRTTAGLMTMTFGASGDKPAPSAFVP